MIRISFRYKNLPTSSQSKFQLKISIDQFSMLQLYPYQFSILLPFWVLTDPHRKFFIANVNFVLQNFSQQNCMCCFAEWSSPSRRDIWLTVSAFHYPTYLKTVIIISQRRIHYFLTIATLIVCGISVIPNFVAVMIGRFLLGVLVSHYLSVSAGYIK